MGISVNNYSSDSITGKIYSKYSTNAIDTNVTDESASYMDFEGYLKLLTSQMSNQDFNNSMSDSEFIQQMASYSMMEAISELTKQNALTYSSSLIGKAVTVSDGTSYDTGLVESVTVTDEGCMLLVNGNLYSADKVTDVVDGQVYSMLNSFKGHMVELKDGDGVITGKVTGIIIQNGNGYVIVDDKDAYSMDAISKILDGEEDSDASGEGSESGEEQSAEVDVSNAAVNSRGEGSGVTYASRASEAQERSAAVYDTLMKMLDDSNRDNVSAVASVEEMYQAAAVMSNLDRLNYRSASVNESDATSALMSGRVPAPINNPEYVPETSDSDSGDILYDQEIFEDTSNNVAQSPFASNGYDNGEEYGVTNVSSSSATSTNLNTYAAQTNTAATYSTSTRKYADQYPVEAAFADSVGTQMADIRFIGNTSVNSIIKTDDIIGYTKRLGHPITDIGWCGYGRLGEVVTFADGTQRVEILYGDKVSHLFTSGRYTIDEIMAGKGKDLTAFEKVIRYHGTEYDPAVQASLDAFAKQCAEHAYYNQIAKNYY